MRNRRRHRLVQPSLQLRFGIAFSAAALGAIVLFSVVLHFGLTELVGVGRSGRVEVADPLRLVMVSALATAAVALPFALLVGALAMFPIAGPLYHLEKHVGRFLSGDDPGDCVLRKGDRMVALNELVNRLTERTRRAEASLAEERARRRYERLDDVPAALPWAEEPEDAHHG